VISLGVYSRTTKGGKVLWYIDYYVAGHRVRERVSESKTQAKAVLTKRKGEIVSGTFHLNDARKTPRFEQFAVEYLTWARQHKRSWWRDEHSLKHLKAFFGARRLSEITTWLVERYKQERLTANGKNGKTPANATVNRELACLKRMYSLAIKWGKATVHPAKPIELLREKEAGRRLTAEEKKKLLAACAEELQPIVRLAMQTGRRRSELLNLSWSDVNLETGTMTLRETKTSDSETIPVNSEVRRLLLQLPRLSQWVFSTPNGSKVKSIRTAFENAVARSGIGHCRFHDLRHTWASEMGEHTDLKTLMKLGGWKRPDVPMRYVHPAEAHERECLEKLAQKQSQRGHTNQTAC
jgi:integrase